LRVNGETEICAEIDSFEKEVKGPEQMRFSHCVKNAEPVDVGYLRELIWRLVIHGEVWN
jgi:hypothetical protein